ncbi:hypothetical protein ABT404_04055 [Streptomyces hyaluromycini]|uniref:Uncharacterized protein n=1 Tax=Streptomyces hyaluromycini TaxID=1377993 RepID=A0ABV1WP90_9ACTN
MSWPRRSADAVVSERERRGGCGEKPRWAARPDWEPFAELGPDEHDTAPPYRRTET